MIDKLRGKVNLLIWLLFISLVLGYLVSQLRIVSDVGQFMPVAQQDSQLQAVMSEVQNGPASTMLMLRIYGVDSAVLAKLSMQLRQELITKGEIFHDVRNGEGAMDWHVAESLFPYRYLLKDEIDWSSAGLRKNFTQRLSELRVGGAYLSEVLMIDPQLVFIKYLNGLFELSGPIKQHGVWFDKEQKNALMVVQVRSKALEIDVMQRAVDEIRLAFHTLQAGSMAQIEIAGPGIMAVDMRSAIEDVMQLMTQFIVVFLIFVFVVGYRSLHSMWLAGLPLISAILIALAITQLVFGEVHSIVLVFGITLLGVCLDYPLHLFSHLCSKESTASSLRRIWPTLRLSGITSVLAFLALLGSGFDGLSQLAIFGACGLIVALGVTRYLLPSLIFPGQIKPRLWPFQIVFSVKQKITAGFILLMVPVLIIVQEEVIWETSIEAISPIPSSSRQRDHVLRSALNVPEVSHVFLQTNTDIDSAIRNSENIHRKLTELQRLNIISSIWSPSQILPSIESQHQRQLLLPDEKNLTKNLEKALEDLPFRAAAFSSWIKSVAESREMKPIEYAEIISTPLGDILRQGLFQYEGQWITVVRIGGIQSEEMLNAWLDTHPDVKKSHVHIKHATEHLLDEYRKTTFERLIMVAGVLVILVFMWSRSIKRSIYILLPVSIGVLTAAAMPLIMGTGINVFHLLAILLVLGMGLDYSLFFNKTQSHELDQQQSFHAISISALTTSAAFSVLSFSSVPVLAGMGLTVSVGVLACFVSSWILANPQIEIKTKGML